MIKGFIINVDGTTEEYEYTSNYTALQEIVSGYIEPVTFGDKSYFCYCNEEGKMLGLPENVVATKLWYDSGQRVLLGDYIAGTVVFFGQVNDEGNDTDYPDQLLKDLAKYVY